MFSILLFGVVIYSLVVGFIIVKKFSSHLTEEEKNKDCQTFRTCDTLDNKEDRLNYDRNNNKPPAKS